MKDKEFKEFNLEFKVHTVKLMHEIADCALQKNTGVLQKPLQIFMHKLHDVATRASQLNDPILNKLMCDLTLYEVSDPESTDYNKETVDLVYKRYEDFKNNSN